jgi:peptidoglycan/LPS O-acetylase OafA/YrhL
MSRSPAKGHIVALTSLRGLAAWWVVAYHFRDQIDGVLPSPVALFVAQGHLAVDLFFVLSGFVIFLNYAPKLTQLSLLAIRDFLIARLARIYPLHLVMSVAYLSVPIALTLFSPGFHWDKRYDLGYWVASLLLVQNWGFFPEIGWNIPSWSISTEWLAYLIFPALAFVLVTRRPSLSALALGIGVLFGIELVLAAALGVPRIGSDIPHFGAVRCLCEFGMGALIACAYHNHPEALRRWRGWLWLAFGVGCVAPYFVDAAFWTIPLTFSALIAVASQSRIAATVLGVSVLVYLGEISYSTYMVHYFVKDWVKLTMLRADEISPAVFASYLVLTGVISALLFRYLELPLRQATREFAGRWFGRRPVTEPLAKV